MVGHHVVQYLVPQSGGQRHQVLGEGVTAQLEHPQTDHLQGRGGCVTDWMDGGADGECHSAARTSPDGSPAETGRMCDGLEGGGRCVSQRSSNIPRRVTCRDGEDV